LPVGTTDLLRGAEAEQTASGVVRVRVAGLVLERLEEEHRDVLSRAVSRVLDRELLLKVEAEEETGGRISQERVREGRLRELIRQEPALEHAVQELDLELLD
jgi:hypothetical protein